VHRFGFNPNDILVVADQKLSFTDYEPQKPTRAHILEAFKTHLIDQAKPDDVVVFHYSGHGSRIIDPHPIPKLMINGEFKDNTDKLNGTIVPIDRVTSDRGKVQDIMGRTLFLLMRSLKTDRVTVVLDSCHSGGGTRGGLTFRAISSRVDGDRYAAASDAELDLQQRLMKDLGISEADLERLRQQGIAKGVAIGSAQFDQSAADAPFDNETFHAGAFTYLLTRYLWQSDTPHESIQTAFANLARSTHDLANKSHVDQVPLLAANPVSNEAQHTYFLSPVKPWAEAVVRDVKPNGQIEYWLGGVSSLSLAASQKDGLWSAIDANGKEIAELVQTNRTGLTATGTVRSGQLSSIQPGTLLREKVRGLPPDLKLQVNLDPSLGNQLEAAKAALQPFSRVQIVNAAQNADCILTRVTPTILQQMKQGQTQAGMELPAAETVGLCLIGLRPIAPTFGPPGEAVEAAVQRLQGRLKSLLAGKLLKLVTGSDAALGGQTSAYKVSVAIIPKDSRATTTPKTFKTGSAIQVQISNQEKHDLYVAVIAISSTGEITPLYPYWDSAENEAILAPGQKPLLTPLDGDGYAFNLTGTGSLEILVLASEKPIRDALKGLQTIAAGRGADASSRSPLSLSGDEELNFVRSLIGDADRNTRADVTISRNVEAINRRQLAAISTIVEVAN